MSISGILKRCFGERRTFRMLDFAGRMMALLVSDRRYLRRLYKYRFGVYPDLQNPQSFNEKIQWRKLNDRQSIYTRCSDKYQVREYVKDIIGEDYLKPLLLATDKPRDIDWDDLPDQFVIKATHGSGWTKIVRDKHAENWRKVLKELKNWLKLNYYYRAREWQYKDIHPMIMIEEMIVGDDGSAPREFEVFCFHGRAHFVQVVTDRGDVRDVDVYDTEWKHLPVCLDKSAQSPNREKPGKLDEILELAETLSEPFDHVRVDFTGINDIIYFGELTFTQGGGLQGYTPSEFEKTLGDEWRLPAPVER